MGNTKPFAKLRGLIKEKYGTQGAFASALGVDESTLSLKLCGRQEWTRVEMEKACKLLGATEQDVVGLFF